jgi:Ala-tRNA(Pro) deacylase
MASFGTVQSEASRVFSQFREANKEVGEGHECWLELSGILNKVEVPADKIPMLTALAMMGVQHNELQIAVREHCETQAPVTKYLKSVENTLTASKGDFLDGEKMTVSDIAMVCALRPLVKCTFSLWEYPLTSAWFKACSTLPQFTSVNNDSFALGGRRVGNQIDERPDPNKARKGAESAQARNVGLKKEASQRSKEKAKKAAAAAKTVSVSAVPATTVQPFSLGERVEVSAGKAARVNAIQNALKTLSIKYETVEHEATETVELMMKATGHLPGGHCKNLFLKAKKPSKMRETDSKLWLVVALHDTKVDLKSISKKLGYKDQLRMGNAETLESKLAVIQGEVSPLALLNNAAADVQVLLDPKMMKLERLWFHPCSMEASTAISPADLLKYIAASGRKVEMIPEDS